MWAGRLVSGWDVLVCSQLRSQLQSACRAATASHGNPLCGDAPLGSSGCSAGGTIDATQGGRPTNAAVPTARLIAQARAQRAVNAPVSRALPQLHASQAAKSVPHAAPPHAPTQSMPLFPMASRLLVEPQSPRPPKPTKPRQFHGTSMPHPPIYPKPSPASQALQHPPCLGWRPPPGRLWTRSWPRTARRATRTKQTPPTLLEDGSRRQGVC